MKRRFLVPEAIQTSAMDCGPAALKSLLEGHDISASYGRLREACQTGVDGTSIDQIEIAALELGLQAEQTMVPVDHLLSDAASVLPALVVTRQSSGLTHFVVVWRKHRGWVQVMDPAAGRRWIREDFFIAEVFRHTHALSAAAWFEWASGDSFLAPLRARMQMTGGVDEALISQALADGHMALARLDAATRMVEALADCGALRRNAAAVLLRAKLARGDSPIPDQYWSASQHPEEPEMILMRGAVLLTVRGRSEGAVAPSSPELAAALQEKPARPLHDLFRTVAKGRGLALTAIATALLAAAAGTLIEAVLLRGFFEIGRNLNVSGQRLTALAALVVLSTIILIMSYSATAGTLRLGRRLEAEIRIRFLSKLPRLADRYFQSRPISDMASRSHQVHLLRQLPPIAAGFMRTIFEMSLTTIGIACLYPSEAWLAILLSAACLAIPMLAQPALSERDLRMRSHAGGLAQYYLDALRGLTAIRAHGAENAIRREQENLLAAWARAGLAAQRLLVTVEGLQLGAAFGLAGWILWRNLQPGADPSSTLLLVYWTLNLPALGQEAAAIAWQYPMQRNTALRVLEPLEAPEEAEPSSPPSEHRKSTAVSIALESVTVRAAGHVILDEVSLSIPAGSHVAIVGASGAGKSSLAGLLLGWHRAADGRVLVDNEALDSAALRRLRAETAWIDPQIQIWNRPLFDNLQYGATSHGGVQMDGILENADLTPVIDKLPAGMQTVLGEGGALVSGGEGQRVRIGRALGRPDARLVILDEPARGLDSSRRRAFLQRAREYWRGATMIAITHDIGDTRAFERVVVIDEGRIVEDGDPAELAADVRSRYRQLLNAEDAVRRRLWSSGQWRRFSIRKGRLAESEREQQERVQGHANLRRNYATSAR